LAQSHAVFFSLDASEPIGTVRGWLHARGLPLLVTRSADELLAIALRSRPPVAIFDASVELHETLGACRQLKHDPYTAVVPAAVFTRNDRDAVSAAFDAGADEVLHDGFSTAEMLQRLDVMMRRAERDVRVHPSTRLPGAPEIEAEIARRIKGGAQFAVCYADLDHFKEYNDRYSYFEGDRVIRILARILHDVVRGTAPDDGFVGHIGGDDFIFVLPVELFPMVCEEIVSIFDALVPYQYSEQDRRAGYYFGKDRRGQLHRVPLMTVSIGVVTNQRRRFTHPAQVSELATEMKSYAKTLPGSIFVADRRQELSVEAPVGAAEQ
jgi:GGDEF domain-containing protein